MRGIIREREKLQDAPGGASRIRPIPPPPGAPCDNDLDDTLVPAIDHLDGFTGQRYPIRHRDTEPATPFFETIQVTSPKAGPPASHGQGFEQAVAVEQPAVRRRYAVGGVAVDQQPNELEIARSIFISRAVLGT